LLSVATTAITLSASTARAWQNYPYSSDGAWV
jgi:hypothetical protein